MEVGEYIGNGNPDGTSFGSSTSEKISFYGVTPVAQTALSAAAVETTVAISTTSEKWGYASSTQANAIVSLVNEIRAALVTLGLKS